MSYAIVSHDGRIVAVVQTRTCATLIKPTGAKIVKLPSKRVTR
jgi:hypothetical protein